MTKMDFSFTDHTYIMRNSFFAKFKRIAIFYTLNVELKNILKPIKNQSDE